MVIERREPPAFRPVEVRHVADRSPRLRRVVLGGPALVGFAIDRPAASVRLLLPRAGDELVLPTWHGNEFLFADGTRPPIRTLTPIGTGAADELGVEVVLHGASTLTTWARSTGAGAPVALSGPGRGYEIDPAARSFLLVGDESALPAITTIVPRLPTEAAVDVVVEVADPVARRDLPPHPRLTIEWCTATAVPGEAMNTAVLRRDVASPTRVWAAGEAAAVQRLRRHLFEERGLARAEAVVRGYWKRGRGAVTQST